MRLLKPGGYFISQQVGEKDFEKLRTIFGTLESAVDFDWDLKTAVTHLKKSGFDIIEKKESIANSRFYDIRSIIYFIKVLEWNFPNFDVKVDKNRITNLYILLKRNGYFEDICHRFFIIAQKPGNVV